MIRFNAWLRTLRGRLTLSLMAVSTVPVVVLSAFFLYTVSETTLKVDQQQARLTERLAGEIAAYVEMHRRGIEAAAKQVSLSKSLPLEAHSQSLQAILESLHQQFPGFINLYIANRDAKTLAFYPEFNASGDSMIGADFSSRWHYAELKKEPKTYISPVMKGVGGTERLLVTIVAPIQRAEDVQSFSGFVLGALDLKKINEIAARAEMPEGSYAVVADFMGQAIARPNFEDGAQPVPASDGSLQKQASESISGAFVHPSSVKDIDVYTTFTRMTSPDWIVSINRPQSLRVADQHASITAGILTMLTLLALLGWIASRFASRTSRRLEVLSQAALRFGEGDFTISFGSDDIHDPSEVRVLRNALSKMASDLKQAQVILLERNADLEEGVRHRTAILEATLSSMEDAFVLLTAEGEIVYANRALRKLLTPSNDETAIDHLDVLMVVLANAGFKKLNRGWFIRGGMQCLVERTDSSWWSLRSFAVRSNASDIGIAVMLRDVSERVKIEHMKNSLISIVAHEMKAPVAAIRMEVDTLRRRDAQWPQPLIDELIKDLHEDTARLEHLVTDWLDATRLESGSLTLTRSEIHLHALIADAIATVRKTSRFSASINIDKHLTLEGDRQRLSQVFVNLLTNAVRYCDREPQVRFSASVEANAIVLLFSDNGIGIAQENWDKIFEKFHQVDMTDTRRQGGTGLGLTISRGIVEAHGGQIRVLSSDPATGTVFVITLPLHSTP